MEEKKKVRKIKRNAKEVNVGRDRGKEGQRCGSVSRNRCREGFRRRQYFNRRQIYRPPAAWPYEMAGARVTCHFVKWSHVSRGHLAVCLLGGSVLSVMCRYARISSLSCPRLALNSQTADSSISIRRASTLVSVTAPTRFFRTH